jgi:hypothetical protein
MSSPAQPYANPFFNITFTHIPTGHLVMFDGFVTGFTDSFTSDWKETAVYGRMDPLATFQRTGRKIQLAFDVIARTQDEAALNDSKINTLIQFLYPVYEATGRRGSNVMTAAPLLKLKWANLANNNGHGYGVAAGANQGLVGFLAGLDYAPQMNMGTFFSPPATKSTAVSEGWKTNRERQTRTASDEYRNSSGRLDDVFVSEDTTTNAMALYHQQISLSLSFTVLHTHLPGWVGKHFGGSTAGSYNFPHGGATRQQEYFAGQEMYDAQGQGYGADGTSLASVTNTPQMVTNTEVNEITQAEYVRRAGQMTADPNSVRNYEDGAHAYNPFTGGHLTGDRATRYTGD